MTDFHLAGRGESCHDLNGIVPETFADQLIKFRIPYSMPGEKVTDPGTSAVPFNEATFLHTIDKPFEVHSMHIDVTGLLAEGVIADPQPETMSKRVRLRMMDTAKNEKITKTPNLVNTMRAFNTHEWRWEVPYTFTRQEGFTIEIDTDVLPSVCVVDDDCTTPEVAAIVQARTEVCFKGYLVVLRPASDQR